VENLSLRFQIISIVRKALVAGWLWLLISDHSPHTTDASRHLQVAGDFIGQIVMSARSFLNQ